MTNFAQNLFSGFMAKTKFVGVNLPMDVDFVEKYVF